MMEKIWKETAQDRYRNVLEEDTEKLERKKNRISGMFKKSYNNE